MGNNEFAKGWQCPICKNVMSPQMSFCVFCAMKPQETITKWVQYYPYPYYPYPTYPSDPITPYNPLEGPKYGPIIWCSTDHVATSSVKSTDETPNVTATRAAGGLCTPT